MISAIIPRPVNSASFPPLPPKAANTEFKYDWSYIVAWVGVAAALCSAILFSLAAVCIKNDREREEAMNMQYLMPGENGSYRSE